VKSPEQFRTEVARRLTNTWHTDLTETTASWPHAFPLGELTRVELEGDFGAVQRRVLDWRDGASLHDVTLTFANRRVHGTTQHIPTHATVPTIDAAATLVGGDWPSRLARGRSRASVLITRFPRLETQAQLLRSVDGYTDTDFVLLCEAADWFNSHDARGLTPRQVPIEGLHAKWLNTHQPQLLALTGKSDLGLLPRHPSRIHFTYLDPAHRAAGGRVHDSATVGDAFTPAYLPSVVLISENKDTAIHFPPVERGIAVEGVGKGGGTAAAFPWITEAPRVYYWGDMDADGYEILDGFRAAGLPVMSILMDLTTFDAYARFGATTDVKGNIIGPGTRKPLAHLTADERAVYERVTDPAWGGVRRLEQERIPLAVALAVVY